MTVFNNYNSRQENELYFELNTRSLPAESIIFPIISTIRFLAISIFNFIRNSISNRDKNNKSTLKNRDLQQLSNPTNNQVEKTTQTRSTKVESLPTDISSRFGKYPPHGERIEKALVPLNNPETIEDDLNKEKLKKIAKDINVSTIHASGNCTLLSRCLLYNLKNKKCILGTKNTFPLNKSVNTVAANKIIFGQHLSIVQTSLRNIDDVEKSLLEAYSKTGERFYVIDAEKHSFNAVILLDQDKPYVQFVDAWKTSNPTPKRHELQIGKKEYFTIFSDTSSKQVKKLHGISDTSSKKIQGSSLPKVFYINDLSFGVKIDQPLTAKTSDASQAHTAHNIHSPTSSPSSIPIVNPEPLTAKTDSERTTGSEITLTSEEPLTAKIDEESDPLFMMEKFNDSVKKMKDSFSEPVKFPKKRKLQEPQTAKTDSERTSEEPQTTKVESHFFPCPRPGSILPPMPERVSPTMKRVNVNYKRYFITNPVTNQIIPKVQDTAIKH